MAIKGVISVVGMTWLAANLLAAAQADVRNGSGREILLQGFHWNSSREPAPGWYARLEGQARQIADDGFTLIWMPPPWRDESQWSDPQKGTSGGGEGYFWRDFDKNSRYGTDAQLRQAAKALRASGVKVVYDVVPNHKAGSCDSLEAGGQGKPEQWCKAAAGRDDGDPFMAGDADLNLTDGEVVGGFDRAFKDLRDNYYADGLRFDYVRGYSAEHVKQWMSNFGADRFCVGELWKEPNGQDLLKSWSDASSCAVFDFALKDRMQNGGLSDWRDGLNGNPQASWRAAAVTFVDNHDTGYSPGLYGGQHHWALAEERRDQAYAFILSTPGTPTVYWPDMYAWPRGALIRELIQQRLRAGIRADSPITFSPRDDGRLISLTQGDKGSLLLALGEELDVVPPGFERVQQIKETSDPQQGASQQRVIRLWYSADRQPWRIVAFSCNNGKTLVGESVYVVGSSPELGGWDPGKAVRLTDTLRYPDWKGHAVVSGAGRIEWKCIVRSEQVPNDVKRWQEGVNNSLEAGAVEGVGTL